MAQQTQQRAPSDLPEPLRVASAALRKVPGSGLVSRAAEGTLDKVGAVSPRGRRLAVYTGAGMLGVAGVVEWPVALTGAAVAWLTQSRPEESACHVLRLRRRPRRPRPDLRPQPPLRLHTPRPVAWAGVAAAIALAVTGQRALPQLEKTVLRLRPREQAE